jgi:hypothetical protein
MRPHQTETARKHGASSTLSKDQNSSCRKIRKLGVQMGRTELLSQYLTRLRLRPTRRVAPQKLDTFTPALVT